MTDFEMFEKNWERAVNGLVGQVANDSRSIFTRKVINDMWQQELLVNRFNSVGIQDEAHLFLDDLFTRRPEEAGRLLEMLRASRLDVGVEVEPTAVKGVAAAGAAVAAGGVLSSDMGTATKLLATALATGAAAYLAGDAAAGLASGTRNAIIRDIREKARQQLEDYRVLLDS